jgi:two-component system, response regulator, stage 0 sporulation protein F
MQSPAYRRRGIRRMYHQAPRTLPKRVLLAEHDDLLRGQLARLLVQDGHVVVQTSDVLGLLDHVAAAYLRHERPFDLLVASTSLEGWSRLQALATLGAVSWGVPVILIADPADREAHAAALRFGALAVFERPFDVDDLRTAILCGSTAQHARIALAR